MEGKENKGSQTSGENSSGPKSVQLLRFQKIEETVKEMIKENPNRFENNSNPFVMVDLGCADGRSATPAFDLMIKVIREVNQDLPICIYLVDAPSTDFSLAMKNVTSGLEKYSNIWIYSIGRSFYESLFPPNSVDLIHSSHALHFIPKVPGTLNSLAYFDVDTMSETPEGKEWQKEAIEAWEKLLCLREKELKKDGCMIGLIPTISDPPTSEDLNFMQPFIGLRKCLINSLNKFQIKDELYHMPIAMRSVTRVKAPFDDKKTQLQLLGMDGCQNSLFVLDQNLEESAKRYIALFRAATSGALRNAMKSNGLEDELINKVFEDLYEKEVREYFHASELSKKPLIASYVILAAKKI